MRAALFSAYALCLYPELLADEASDRMPAPINLGSGGALRDGPLHSRLPVGHTILPLRTRQ